MSKPRLENGYTRVANEIMEALARINLSPYESRVLWFILRKTYGWQKKSDLIPLSQIAQGTGISKPNVCHSLKRLLARSIIVRLDNKHIGFQKDYEKWLQKLSKQTIRGKLSKQTISIVDLDNKSLSILTPSKESTKETISKETEPSGARQGQKTDIDTLRRQGKFPDWLAYLNQSANKVGVLIEAFKAWHKTAPDIDWENTGGRMANLFTLANKDAGYLLKILWETAAADIAGSHLSFIQGKLRAPGSRATPKGCLPTGDELERSWEGNEIGKHTVA